MEIGFALIIIASRNFLVSGLIAGIDSSGKLTLVAPCELARQAPELRLVPVNLDAERGEDAIPCCPIQLHRDQVALSKPVAWKEYIRFPRDDYQRPSVAACLGLGSEQITALMDHSESSDTGEMPSRLAAIREQLNPTRSRAAAAPPKRHSNPFGDSEGSEEEGEYEQLPREQPPNDPFLNALNSMQSQLGGGLTSSVGAGGMDPVTQSMMHMFLGTRAQQEFPQLTSAGAPSTQMPRTSVAPPPPATTNSSPSTDDLMKMFLMMQIRNMSNNEGQGGANQIARGFERMDGLIAELDLNPGKIVNEFREMIIRDRDIKPGEHWSYKDYWRTQQYGRFRSVGRMTYGLASILDSFEAGKPEVARAKAIQLWKAGHQFALDQGSWKAAWLMSRQDDPFKAKEFPGTAQELSTVGGYMKSQADLKARITNPYALSQPQDDEEQEEGPAEAETKPKGKPRPRKPPKKD
eukprot:CAMPEP_0169333574 /NCGR_PEP_ID=MMETSP1017-20121227/15331_1 /TAXON_ID=342587 /ORGANISM="Karlodinium micrum, Strain CCMP2283" /LENGTH=463 /DNA_ID=CAMNT_0009428803 /DNA_START=44 /DNA_END=1435 /DNA_ORIENTATION=-